MALSEQQYDRIMESYYENQFNNRALEQERKEEIYQKIPRIEEIDNQIATSSIQAARAKLLNQDISIEKIKEDNRKLIAEKNTLLEKNGYPADYLQPIYTCPKCKDTGKINQEYCSCFKQAALTYLYKQSTIEDKLKSENFDVFCLDYYTKETSTQHPTSAYDNAAYILKQRKYGTAIRTSFRRPWQDLFPKRNTSIFQTIRRSIYRQKSRNRAPFSALYRGPPEAILLYRALRKQSRLRYKIFFFRSSRNRNRRSRRFSVCRRA